MTLKSGTTLKNLTLTINLTKMSDIDVKNLTYVPIDRTFCAEIMYCKEVVLLVKQNFNCGLVR